MRFFTEEQKELLRSESLRVNILVTMYFDGDEIVQLCDHTEDLTDGANTWLGANMLLEATEIRAGAPMTAESVTITVDGNRLNALGLDDPDAILNLLFTVDFHQRRVDIDFAFSAIDSQHIDLIVPGYAGKINYARLVHEGIDLNDGGQTFAKLEIVLDSLAARYRRATHRTRSNEDQEEIAPGDKFYSFVTSAVLQESTLYWGKAAPNGTRPPIGSTGGGGRPGYDVYEQDS